MYQCDIVMHKNYYVLVTYIFYLVEIFLFHFSYGTETNTFNLAIIFISYLCQ